nr:inactive ubiquitin carboxyl-terminal hydrolase MINDY-4B-like [Penaeus vannamei]
MHRRYEKLRREKCTKEYGTEMKIQEEQKKSEKDEEEKKSALRAKSLRKMVKKVVHTQVTFHAVDIRRKRVLYPTNSRTCLQKLPVVGGSPVTPEKAKMLRQKVFGAASLVGPVETDWLNQSFCFHPHDSPLGYGLKVAKGITKGFIMCVQGFVLKNLLFGRRRLSVGVEPRNLLKTTVRAQEDALVEALADVLWQAGGRTGAFLCLTQENVYLTTDEDYQCDGCTERLHIFEYSKQDELRFNVKKYLYETCQPVISHHRPVNSHKSSQNLSISHKSSQTVNQSSPTSVITDLSTVISHHKPFNQS